MDNYPEIVGKLLIINAPMVFTGIWAFIKGFLDERLKNKITLLGKNYMPTLLEYIDLDQIPEYLGGTNT